jgi:hypothetical protein
VVHHVPTGHNLDTLMERLLKVNGTVIDPDDILSAHWLTRKPMNKPKCHSSLVLQILCKEAANACIKSHLALDGYLHWVERYRSRPVQCFNCYHYSHLTAYCKQPTVCRKCAQLHLPNSQCPCSNTKPCKDLTKCSHASVKCIYRCSEAHTSTSMKCPI